MSKKQRASVSIMAIGAIALIAIILVGIGRNQETALADDSLRTTTLTNAGGKITATLNSTYGADEQWKISLFFTPLAGVEESNGSTSSTRTDGLTSGMTWKLEATSSQFVSGDTVRARFQTFTSAGNGLFDFSRTLTIP